MCYRIAKLGKENFMVSYHFLQELAKIPQSFPVVNLESLRRHFIFTHRNDGAKLLRMMLFSALIWEAFKLISDYKT